MKLLLSSVLLFATAAPADNWDVRKINETHNSSNADYQMIVQTRAGRQLDSVTYDSGLGNYYPYPYLYPQSSFKVNDESNQKGNHLNK